MPFILEKGEKIIKEDSAGIQVNQGEREYGRIALTNLRLLVFVRKRWRKEDLLASIPLNSIQSVDPAGFFPRAFEVTFTDTMGHIVTYRFFTLGAGFYNFTKKGKDWQNGWVNALLGQEQ